MMQHISNRMTTDEILDHLEVMFPDAHCELNHRNSFELLVAVSLSAQTTDASVNRITPALFEKYPTPNELAQADLKDIENLIHSIGLYRNKAKNIKKLSMALIENFDGQVPSTRKELMTLPGVGRKTANVILSVCYQIPAIAVDTHVDRISKRLGLAKKEDDVLKVEEKLRRKIRRDRWCRAHHLLIFFGRYQCKAKNPQCDGCPFASFCKEKR